MGVPLSTSTKTVLFTDLEDYTASVSEMDRAQLHALIEEHEQKVAFVLQQHGGQIVKSIGDSFLSVFDSATDAIKAGLALQTSLQDDPDFNVRIGIATGDVEQIGDDFFGSCVNLASRILSQTPSEEIWFAQSTFLAMNPSEIAWDEVGRFLFKGFFFEMPVYRAIPHHAFCPNAEFLKISNTLDVVVYRYGDIVPTITRNDVVVVLNAPTDTKGQEDVCSQLSFVPIQQIWLCGYYLSPKDRYSWLGKGGKWLIGDELMIQQALQLVEEEEESEEGQTIILSRDRAFLSLSGLALPRPPIADVIGYRYYLDRAGNWSSVSQSPLLSVQVSQNSVVLHILTSGVHIDRNPVPQGREIELTADTFISVQNFLLSYLHFGNKVLWGMFDGVDECQLFLEEGKRIELGREFATSTFSLRNSRQQGHLIWASTASAEQLKKQGFTLERGLVGRKQVVVEAQNNGFLITQLHPHCPSYIIHDGECSSLAVQKQHLMRGMQKLILGTNVFSINFQ